MGKIRTKTLGDESVEQEEQKKQKVKREQKKAREGGVVSAEAEVKDTKETTGAKDAKGTKEAEGTPLRQGSAGQAKGAEGTKEEKQGKKEKKAKFAKTKKRSKRYLDSALSIDKNKTYTLKEGLALLPTLGKASFDETVELHINTTETGVNATLTLPHGTGKQTRVAIADDDVIAQVEKGKIDFDILLAAPQMMPKLAKVAKILGPKGLMPNPKNGTIGPNPQELAKQFAGGRMTIKTELKFPIMHVAVGKVSFGQEKLSENITAVAKAVGTGKMKKVVLKSTMSPAISISL